MWCHSPADVQIDKNKSTSLTYDVNWRNAEFIYPVCSVAGIIGNYFCSAGEKPGVSDEKPSAELLDENRRHYPDV